MRKKFAELWWLSLPVLVLLAVAGWLGVQPKRKSEIAVDRTGPLRTVYGKWESVSGAPRAVFEGYRWWLEVPIVVAGKVPEKFQAISDPIVRYADADCRLEVKQEGKWIQWAATTRDGRPGIMLRRVFSERRQRLALVAALPEAVPNVDEIRVVGGVRAYGSFEVPVQMAPVIRSWKNPAITWVNTFNNKTIVSHRLEWQPVEVSLWKRGQEWPRPKPDRTPGSTILETETPHALTSEPGKRLLGFKLKYKALPDMSSGWVSAEASEILKSELLDSRGNILPVQSTAGIDRYTYFTTDPDRSIRSVYINVGHDTKLPPGDIYWRGYLAVGDRWPVTVKQLIRPAWMERKSKMLTLQSVSVGNYWPGHYTITMLDFRFKYNGAKALWIGIPLSQYGPGFSVKTDARMSYGNPLRNGPVPPDHTVLRVEESPVMVNSRGTVLHKYDMGRPPGNANRNVSEHRMEMLSDGTLRFLLPVFGEREKWDERTSFQHRVAHFTLGIEGDGVVKVRYPLRSINKTGNSVGLPDLQGANPWD